MLIYYFNLFWISNDQIHPSVVFWGTSQITLLCGVFMWTFDAIILSISKIEFFFFCDLNKIYMYIVNGITNVVQLCYILDMP
jgi:hypothetical protein